MRIWCSIASIRHQVGLSFFGNSTVNRRMVALGRVVYIFACTRVPLRIANVLLAEATGIMAAVFVNPVKLQCSYCCKKDQHQLTTSYERRLLTLNTIDWHFGIQYSVGNVSCGNKQVRNLSGTFHRLQADVTAYTITRVVQLSPRRVQQSRLYT